MSQVLRKEDFMRILREIQKLMEDNKEHLCKLDGSLGDGDLGLTMSKGFQAVNENLPNLTDENIGALLMKSSLVMGEAAASTMGTLVSSALLKGGKALAGKTEVGTEDFSLLLDAMIEGITARGKAKVGDKTILDSLVPASEAVKQAIADNKSLRETLAAAFTAAEQGAHSTIQMQSRHGRAARYLERSIGIQDPGAAVGALMLKAFADAVQ
jgi:dihydroxyacetone kinase-like protein